MTKTLFDTGPNARSVQIELSPFTLVGATTRSGLLTAPMRARFGINRKCSSVYQFKDNKFKIKVYENTTLVDVVIESLHGR